MAMMDDVPPMIMVVPAPGIPWTHSGQVFTDNSGTVWTIWIVPCVPYTPTPPLPPQCLPISISAGIIDTVVVKTSPDSLIRQAFQGVHACSKAELTIPSLSSEEAMDVARGLDIRRAIMCPSANYFLWTLIVHHFDSVANIIVDALQNTGGGLHWAARHLYGYHVVCCLAEKTTHDTLAEKALLAMLSSDRAKELVSDVYAWRVISVCIKKSTLAVSTAALQLVRDEIWKLLYFPRGRRLLEIAVTVDTWIAKKLTSADYFLLELEKKTRSMRLLRRAVRRAQSSQS